MKPKVIHGALGEKWRKVTGLDLVTLLYHLHKAAETKDIGFEDANNTLDQMSRKLRRVHAWINQSDVESVLWSCNLMDEKGEFWSPRGETLDAFLKRVAPEGFHKVYNTIKEK